MRRVRKTHFWLLWFTIFTVSSLSHASQQKHHNLYDVTEKIEKLIGFIDSYGEFDSQDTKWTTLSFCKVEKSKEILIKNDKYKFRAILSFNKAGHLSIRVFELENTLFLKGAIQEVEISSREVNGLKPLLLLEEDTMIETLRIQGKINLIVEDAWGKRGSIENLLGHSIRDLCIPSGSGVELYHRYSDQIDYLPLGKGLKHTIPPVRIVIGSSKVRLQVMDPQVKGGFIRDLDAIVN